MAAIFDFLVTLASKSISRSVLLDPTHVGVAIILESRRYHVYKLIYIHIAHVLPVRAAIFDFPGHSCNEEYSL